MHVFSVKLWERQRKQGESKTDPQEYHQWRRCEGGLTLKGCGGQVHTMLSHKTKKAAHVFRDNGEPTNNFLQKKYMPHDRINMSVSC